MPEIYVSTDVETDGPIPGPNSSSASGRRPTLHKTLLAFLSPPICTCAGSGPGDPRPMNRCAQKQAAFDATPH